MPVEAQQIIRSRRKTIALIVKPDGSLVVRAPLRVPGRTIREFIEKNTDWVRKKQAEMLAASLPRPKQHLPGELFPYLGEHYPLAIREGQSIPLLLNGCFQLAESAQGRAGLVFERWYRAQAKRILSERVALYASRHQFHYKRIGITSARTRWGSCSANGSLNFSWRLILAPLDSVDYVVVHELVHTDLHNHSREFWQRVESIMPDYQERRTWLRKNGQQLVL